MFALVRNLPKWLLAVLAVSIIGGYVHQLECKPSGCGHAAAAASTSNAGDGGCDGETPGSQDHSHCACECHFTILAPAKLASAWTAVIRKPTERTIPRADRAPESPCEEIDYPPQLIA